MKPVAYRKVARALRRLGFDVIRQRGSHVRFSHRDGRKVTVPNHPGRDVAPGTLRAICSEIDVEPDDLVARM